MKCSSSGLWKRRCSCTDLHVCFWAWRHFRFHLIDHGYVSALPTLPSLACRAVWTLSLSPILRVLSCFSEDSYTILPHARSCSCRGLELSLGLLFKKKEKVRTRASTARDRKIDGLCFFFFYLVLLQWHTWKSFTEVQYHEMHTGKLQMKLLYIDRPHAVNLFRWNSAKVDIQASKTILGGLDPFITISRNFTEVWVFAFISSYHPLSTLCRHAVAADLTAERGQWCQSSVPPCPKVSTGLRPGDRVGHLSPSHRGIIFIGMGVVNSNTLVGASTQTIGTKGSKWSVFSFGTGVNSERFQWISTESRLDTTNDGEVLFLRCDWSCQNFLTSLAMLLGLRERFAILQLHFMSFFGILAQV